MDAGEDAPACPVCGEAHPRGARSCPHCEADLTPDGSAIDLSELDGSLGPEAQEALLSIDATGRRRASRSVRILSGLAVSVPLAPLALFLVGSVASLSVWSAAAVFLLGWLGPAAILSRARMPAVAFGRSLYAVAVGTALVPVALAAGRETGELADSLSIPFGTVTAVSVVVAGAAVLLGTYVSRQARRRVTGELRAFEELRED